MLAQNNRLKRRGIGMAVTALLVMMMLVFSVGCNKKDDAAGDKAQAPAAASDAGMGATQPVAQAVDPAQQELQAKVARFNQLKQELKIIQDAAMANNPDLQTQQQELQTLIQETMEKKLADADVDVERIKQLQMDLQKPDITDEKKETLSAEFREQAQAYTKIQRETLADEMITDKSNRFREGLEAAMKKENPDCGDMMEELKGLLALFQQMQQQSMAQPQAAPAPTASEAPAAE